jgi:hypothetical protein
MDFTMEVIIAVAVVMISSQLTTIILPFPSTSLRKTSRIRKSCLSFPTCHKSHFSRDYCSFSSSTFIRNIDWFALVQQHLPDFTTNSVVGMCNNPRPSADELLFIELLTTILNYQPSPLILVPFRDTHIIALPKGSAVYILQCYIVRWFLFIPFDQLWSYRLIVSYLCLMLWLKATWSFYRLWWVCFWQIVNLLSLFIIKSWLLHCDTASSQKSLIYLALFPYVFPYIIFINFFRISLMLHISNL